MDLRGQLLGTFRNGAAARRAKKKARLDEEQGSAETVPAQVGVSGSSRHFQVDGVCPEGAASDLSGENIRGSGSMSAVPDINDPSVTEVGANASMPPVPPEFVLHSPGGYPSQTVTYFKLAEPHVLHSEGESSFSPLLPLKMDGRDASEFEGYFLDLTGFSKICLPTSPEEAAGVIRDMLVFSEGTRASSSTRSSEEIVRALGGQWVSYYREFDRLVRVSAAEKRELVFARDQALTAQEKATAECSKKQEEISCLTKEIEDLKARERVAIEEKDAALKRSSEMEEKVSTLTTSLHTEREQACLFEGLLEWAITETAKKMMNALTESHDEDIIKIDEVLDRFEEGRSEVLSREAYLKEKGVTLSSAPPQDP